MAKYEIPVKYECVDTIEVNADSLEEAILKVKEGKVEDIMREKDPQYIDKTCVIDDRKDGNASMEDTLKIINDYNS